MARTELTNHTDTTTRDVVNRLQVGNRVEITHEVKVGLQVWMTTTQGTVDRIERRRHGLHFRRNPDDKVFSDMVVLRLDDGSITTLAIDEFTDLRIVS